MPVYVPALAREERKCSSTPKHPFYFSGCKQKEETPTTIDTRSQEKVEKMAVSKLGDIQVVPGFQFQIQRPLI
ncbi:MAG: hypothetical protein COB67_06700 [SAR324 cluster bacterium]|uniref:Uncharacterized protein n=1 Tax=SAR324 cluster bacterium TaxID=2024889 RepID=A0A2A4T4L7_9DELT|nr:MAG: hypothetical protein COB67_06700 [SAR324 cluster bacterium]